MILPIIGAAVGLGSAVAGSVASAKQTKKEQALLDQQQNSLDYWYQKEMSEDYMDSDIAKSTINYLDRSSEKAQDAMLGNIVKNGSSAEEKVAMASALNQNYASQISKLATNAAAEKKQNETYYMNKSNEIANKKLSYTNNNALGSIASIGASIGNNLTVLDAALSSGALTKQPVVAISAKDISAAQGIKQYGIDSGLNSYQQLTQMYNTNIY